MGVNLVRVRNVVVTAIFGGLGRVEIVTLTVGARAKEEKGGGSFDNVSAKLQNTRPTEYLT